MKSIVASILCLSCLYSCAMNVETPKLYMPVGNTGTAVYVYGGIGLVPVDPDGSTLAK